MKHLDTKTLDTAFVRPGTPMLSDVIRHLEENPELFGTRPRDMISGLRRVARALGPAAGRGSGRTGLAAAAPAEGGAGGSWVNAEVVEQCPE